MEPNERFKILNDFTGWGNPRNAIWFVGIEEGGSWDREWCKNHYNNELGVIDFQRNEDYCRYVDYILERDYQPLHGAKNILCKAGEYCPAPLYRNVSKICSKLFKIDEKEYNSKFLGKEKDNSIPYNSFMTNIFPLGIRNICPSEWLKLFPDYKEMFDLPDTFIDKCKYYEHSRPIRFKLLKDLFAQSSPYAIICMGKGFKEDFINCFNIPNGKDEFVPVGNRTYSYYKIVRDETLVLIINHLSRGIPEKYRDKIVDEIENHLNYETRKSS